MENTSANTDATGCNAEVETLLRSPLHLQSSLSLSSPSLLLPKTKRTSICWQYFERIKDEHGVVIKGTCIYYAKN